MLASRSCYKSCPCWLLTSDVLPEFCCANLTRPEEQIAICAVTLADVPNKLSRLDHWSLDVMCLLAESWHHLCMSSRDDSDRCLCRCAHSQHLRLPALDPITSGSGLSDWKSCRWDLALEARRKEEESSWFPSCRHLSRPGSKGIRKGSQYGSLPSSKGSEVWAFSMVDGDSKVDKTSRKALFGPCLGVWGPWLVVALGSR